MSKKRPQFSHFSQSKISMSRSLSKGLVASCWIKNANSTWHCSRIQRSRDPKKATFFVAASTIHTTLHGTMGSKPFWSLLKFFVQSLLENLGKVEKHLKGSLNLIPSPSPSMKIQIMGVKVCLRCRCKILLGVVNKLLKCFAL